MEIEPSWLFRLKYLLLIGFWSWKGPIVCTAHLASTWWVALPVQVPFHGLEGNVHLFETLQDPFFPFWTCCSGCALAWASTCFRVALDSCSCSLIFAKETLASQSSTATLLVLFAFMIYVSSSDFLTFVRYTQIPTKRKVFVLRQRNTISRSPRTPQTHRKKLLVTGTSRDEAILIFIGLNFHDAYCIS